MELSSIKEVESRFEDDFECGDLDDDQKSNLSSGGKYNEDVRKFQVVECINPLKKMTKICVALYLVVKIMSNKALLSTLARVLPRIKQIILKSPKNILSFVLGIYHIITNFNSIH